MPTKQPKSQQQSLQSLLRIARIEAGLKQAQLAKRLHRPQSYVSKYEAGERRLDLIELRQICLNLGTTLAELVKRFEGEISES